MLVSTGIVPAFSTVTLRGSGADNTKTLEAEREAGLKSISFCASEMGTVHRNRTLSRRYIRNGYCAQKQNTFQTVHQKCVLCTETEHYPTLCCPVISVHSINMALSADRPLAWRSNNKKERTVVVGQNDVNWSYVCVGLCVCGHC